MRVETNTSVYELSYDVEEEYPFKLEKIKNLEEGVSDASEEKIVYGNRLILSPFALSLFQGEFLVAMTTCVVKID